MSLSITYGNLLQTDPQIMASVFSELHAIPLSISNRMDLKDITDTLSKELNRLNEMKMDALKKYGAREEGGRLEITQNDPGFPEFMNEINEIAAKAIDLTIKDKMKIPCKINYLGKDHAIQLTGPAYDFATLFIDFVREG